MSDHPARFPVMAESYNARLFPPRSVPWAVVAPHEKQAKHNHDQTLQRLAQRGGLSALELYCVLHGDDLRLIWDATCPTEEQALLYIRGRVLAVEQDPLWLPEQPWTVNPRWRPVRTR